MIISVKEGWNTRSNNVESTEHGYAKFGSMNEPFMVYQPGQDLGGKEINRSVRSADLTPTVLRLLGIKWRENSSYGKWFDGNILDPAQKLK